jgi:hypothetical protein
MSARLAPTEQSLQAIGWASIAVSIVAWMAHLIGSAGTVAFAREQDAKWLLHLGTLVAVLVVVAAGAASLYVLARSKTAEDEESAHQLHFLGVLGAVTALFNLVLVLAEGSFVIWLWPHA